MLPANRLRTVVCVLGLAAIPTLGHTAAFPGAQGFGANASGGRGGSVYIVTNLNDSGAGSFRDAVSQPNRTVVFAVGGIINIVTRVVISANVTIAGQTAPGDGITIYGNGVSYSNANNTITRYIRFRMGVGGDSGKDTITIAEGTTMMFDHISDSWGRDGTFDINGDVSNITISDSIIAQGLETHSTGGLIQSTGGVSILRSLYIDNNTRNPKVKGINQFVNNVIYNWKGDGYILGDSAGVSEANVIGNYFIDGPSSTGGAFTRGNTNFHLYASGNYRDNNRNGSLDGYLIPQNEYTTVTWMTSPFAHPSVTTTTAQAAYSHVVANAGASRRRDRVDNRLIQELQSIGTMGQIISDENASPMNGPAPVAGGTAPTDTDKDGMPDSYETSVGLNPNSADNNGDQNGNGYTNLEDYINGLVGSPTPTPTARPTATPTTRPTARATPTATTRPTATPRVRPTPTATTRPTPTPTMAPVTYQAESAVLAGGSAVETTNAGFNGTGYVNSPTTGGSIEFRNVSGGTGGSRSLRFRNALASGSRTGRLLVNGAAQNITFAATGSWTTWTLHTVTATLNSGTTNTVRLETNGADLANIDELTVQ